MAPPQFQIPESTSTADVHIINSTSRIRGIPTDLMMEPHIDNFDVLDCPAFSFLIEHPKSHQKVLFDLGVRKDWENLSARIVKRLKDGGWQVEVEKGVADILKENNVDLKSINAVIWSHYHWDHTGDPSTFPPSTDLVVGPGFKKAFIPGYPKAQDSPIRESDYEGRNLREICFDPKFQIGGYAAFDYFGDGSFYLLDSPGHAIGHMCGLVRTTATPSTFLLLGGDCAHHPGEFRPSPTRPLPPIISPSPLPRLHPNTCPAAVFFPIHRLYSPSNRPHASHLPSDHPFYLPAASGAHNVEEARASAEKLGGFDGREDCFVVVAHDASLLVLGEAGFFPGGKANVWREEGWRERVGWGFLSDFEEAVKMVEDRGRGGA